MKLTAYIRFIVGGLYFLNFLFNFLTSDYGSETEPLLWASELFAGLVALVYITYCIRQGTKELKNDNSELPYPRILAILIELFSVVIFIFNLTQLEQIDFISILPNLILVTGMGYLLTQNLKIVINRK
ncbi:MAG: hypothetical protein RLN90_07335 [Balneolaceae bacterium]